MRFDRASTASVHPLQRPRHAARGEVAIVTMGCLWMHSMRLLAVNSVTQAAPLRRDITALQSTHSDGGALKALVRASYSLCARCYVTTLTVTFKRHSYH